MIRAIKRLSKENQTNITRIHESGIKSKVIEEEKERMISSWDEDEMGRETSNGIFTCPIAKNEDGIVTEAKLSVLIIKRKSELMLTELATKITRK